MIVLTQEIYHRDGHVLYTYRTADTLLHALAVHHGTGKVIHPGYLEAYWRRLAHRRNESLTLLEIGIEEGRSLRLWRDFLPNARIVGIDWNPECQQHAEERIQIAIGNQADTDFLQTIALGWGPFDLIIDDGGHVSTEQQVSLRTLWPHLKPGGWYAIEDLETCYHTAQWPSMVDSLKGLIDKMNVGTWLFRQGTPPLSEVLPGLAGLCFYPNMCFLDKEPDRGLD